MAEKKKRTSQHWWLRSIPAWLVLILVIAGIIGYMTIQRTPYYVEVTPAVVITATPSAYSAPNTNRTFVSPVSSATPAEPQDRLSAEAYQREHLLHNSCGGDGNLAKGYFVFRIWLQQSMELFRVDEDGENFCYLTDDEYMDDQPKWSPNGDQIAFVSNREGYGIYVMDFWGENIQRITTGGSAYGFPTWSPDGGTIYYQATIDERFDIYAFDLQTGQQRNVTNHERLDTMPSISPDGQYIAFASDRSFNPFVDNNPQAQSDSYDIYVANIDGTNARRLTVEVGNDTAPEWSQDGNQIAYINANGEIVIMNVDGSDKLVVGDRWKADFDWVDTTHIVMVSPLRIMNIADQNTIEINTVPTIGSGIQYLDYTPLLDAN